MKFQSLVFMFTFILNSYTFAQTTSILSVDDSGERLITYAKLGDVERVQELIDADVDPNSTSTNIAPLHISTPLLFAVHNGHIEMARTLIDAGSDVNNLTVHGMGSFVPLTIAIKKNHPEMVQTLIDAEANVNGVLRTTSNEYEFDLSSNLLTRTIRTYENARLYQVGTTADAYEILTMLLEAGATTDNLSWLENRKIMEILRTEGEKQT